MSENVSMSRVPPQTDLETLALTIGQHLLRRGEMLATAESCTGGWVAQSLTAIAGSSAWFDRGFVTYSNAAKVEQLGVPEGVLAAQGAVAEVTAAAMAQGVLQHSQSDWAISTTGIAGPTGGSAEKPVGMVCFAWAHRGQGVSHETAYFEGDRAAVRAQAVAYVLQGLLSRIM